MLLEGPLEPRHQGLTVQLVAVDPSLRPAGEAPADRVEERGSHDRDSDDGGQAERGHGQAQRRGDRRVGARDDQPQRREHQGPPRRPVDVEQVRPDQPDRDRDRQHHQEPSPRRRRPDRSAPPPRLARAAVAGISPTHQDAVHRPPDLPSPRWCQPAVARGDQDRPDEWPQGERAVQHRRPSGAARKDSAGTCTGLSISGNPAAARSVPQANAHIGCRVRPATSSARGSASTSARCDDDHPSLVAAVVAAVRVDGEHRDHAGLEPEAHDLGGHVGRTQPPARTDLVEGDHQPHDRPDERPRHGAEEEDPVARRRRRRGAGRPHSPPGST